MIEGCNCGQDPDFLQNGYQVSLRCKHCNRYIPCQPSQEQAVIVWNSMILENRMQIIARRKDGEFVRFSQLPTPEMIKEINKNLQEIANTPWKDLEDENSPSYLMSRIEEIQCKLITLDKISTTRIRDFIDEAENGKLFPPNENTVSIEDAFCIIGKHFGNLQKAVSTMTDQLGDFNA